MKRVATILAVAILTFAVVFSCACSASAEQYLGWTKADWDSADYEKKAEVAKALREDFANAAIEYSDFVPQAGCTSCSWAGCRWGMCQGCSADPSFQAVRNSIESLSPGTIIEGIDAFFRKAGEGATLQSFVDEFESQIKQAKSAAALIQAWADQAGY